MSESILRPFWLPLRGASLLLATALLLTGTWACVDPARHPPAHAGASEHEEQSTAATAEGDPVASTSRPEREPMKKLTAWEAVPLMTPGVNIGNTLENTSEWETGWGNPPITQAFVESLRDKGFRSVRVPVAWDTYADDGRIDKAKIERVEQVVDWIIDAGMFAVVNIHWDGGWIDSGDKKNYPETHATFSAEAERKFPAYWKQIATHFRDKSEKLLFEALNEETHFENEGSTKEAYATLTRVNQIFIDTVRATGGNNAERLLVVTGYHTDIKKTCAPEYELPKDTARDKLFLSVHYYTPFQFCGLTEDADWGKMMPTWGAPKDYEQLDSLFDELGALSKEHGVPVYLGEYGVTGEKESASRKRWLNAVAKATVSRRMVPVLWDTGGDVSRHPPFEVSAEVLEMLEVAEKTTVDSTWALEKQSQN